MAYDAVVRQNTEQFQQLQQQGAQIQQQGAQIQQQGAQIQQQGMQLEAMHQELTRLQGVERDHEQLKVKHGQAMSENNALKASAASGTGFAHRLSNTHQAIEGAKEIMQKEIAPILTNIVRALGGTLDKVYQTLEGAAKSSQPLDASVAANGSIFIDDSDL